MYSKTIKAAGVAQSVHMCVTVLGLVASHYFGSSADHSSLVGNHKMCIGQSTAEVQSSLSQEMESKRGDRTAYLILFFFLNHALPSSFSSLLPFLQMLYPLRKVFPTQKHTYRALFT